MAYIILAGKRDTEQVEAQNKMSLSDADYERVAYWGAKAYFPNGIMQEDGTPRQPTGDEIFEAITNEVYTQIKRDVEALYLREAEAAARASVPPIVLTPVE